MMTGPGLSILLAVAQPVVPATQSEIVVIGRRAERALEACIARDCPPAEEVEASLQASVEQFSNARYNDARLTLRRAIARNRQHAATMPGPVSSLYFTLADVVEHEGDLPLALSAERDGVIVLRDHVGREHPATLVQELSLADSFVGRNAPQLADSVYRRVERTARQIGQPQIAVAAGLRRAWNALSAGRYARAEQLADEAVAAAGAEPAVQQRDIIHARAAVGRGDPGAVDALAARLRQSPTVRPRLLWARPLENMNPERLPGTERGAGFDNGQIHFADVGYWIRPDGRTAGVEMLREKGLHVWREAVLEQVATRRYTPLDLDPTHPGLYRIDRFTLRGNFTASGIRLRSGPVRVYVADLTDTDAMADEVRQGIDDPPAYSELATPDRPRSEP